MARKTAERAAAQRKARTRKATLDKNNASHALAVLAHEVRTPLNGILALTELLAASSLPAREQEWVSTIRASAEQLARLTTLVVDAGRASTRKISPVRERFDPRQVAAAAASSLTARATMHKLTSDVRIDDSVPSGALGDPVRLWGALENLIDNAVKFSPPGTAVTLTAAAADTAQGACLTFTVTDHGPGLSKAQLARLFRPYAQANPRGARFAGSGLGLYLARAAARAAGGDVTVTSTPGQGSTFRLDVGIVAVADASNAPDHPLSLGPALRILCAEDNPYGRVVINTIAAALGHHVTFVESGDAAVTSVRKAAPDLVLMDLSLPGCSGLDAARQIRALAGAGAAVPIIGISGHDDASDETAARSAGMNAYLTKPVSARALAEAIAGVMKS